MDDALDLEYRLLGPVAATRDGQAVELGGPRQRALLALLLVEAGRLVPQERLIDELWAGEPTDGAETTLRSYVSRLRRSLGDPSPIRGSSEGYALDVAPDRLDVRRFERRIREGEAALADRAPRRAVERLDEALELWRGAPFGNVATDGALRTEAVRLGELRLRAIQLRLEARLGLGASGELVDELEALVAEHPYREPFWRQLMLALYRAGRQGDALEAFHRARTALDEHLGIDPGPELHELQAAILNQDVPPVEPVGSSHDLPADLTSFLGREAELAEVDRLLRSARLVTLTGVGGVGKTRLGLEAARRHLDDHPDGVHFVDLAPIADDLLVAPHVAALLGVREQAQRPALDLLASHVAGSRLLLLLDNCEQVREGVAELATHLLRAAPELRLLATSRQLLGVPGEQEYAVPPFTVAPRAGRAVAELRASEAVQLFLARAREASPRLADDDRAIEVIHRICSDLDGLPLAIELAAARARALSTDEIAARIGDRFKFLVSWRRVTTARHRTLREAMTWSFDLLEPPARRLLEDVSVFAGSFTLDAAEAVYGPELEGAGALEVIERLVEASLVIVDAATTPTRYRLLETVRQFAAERLEAAGRADAVGARHAGHYLDLAMESYDPVRGAGPGQEIWIERLGRERDNLRTALETFRQAGRRLELLRLTEALWWFWWMRGELAEGRRWLEVALGPTLERSPPSAGSDPVAAEPGGRPEQAIEARALTGLAGLEWAQGDLARARQHAELARDLHDRLGDHAQAGNARNTLGVIAYGERDLEHAREHFQSAIARYELADLEAVRRAQVIATATDNLGSVAFELGDDEQAWTLFQSALAMYGEHGHREGVAMVELHLATVAARNDRLDEARPLLVRALRVYDDLGFLHYLAEGLDLAVAIANRLGEPREAAWLLGAADRLRDETGTPPIPYLVGLRAREAAAAEAALGAEAAAEARSEGRVAPTRDAVARAIRLLED